MYSVDDDRKELEWIIKDWEWHLAHQSPLPYEYADLSGVPDDQLYIIVFYGDCDDDLGGMVFAGVSELVRRAARENITPWDYFRPMAESDEEPDMETWVKFEPSSSLIRVAGLAS